MSSKTMRLKLKIWRQKGPKANGKMVDYTLNEVNPEMSFLEMMDVLNQVKVPGSAHEMNPELEKAIRVADFLELGELMCYDALNRNESCGGHFREEYQTEDGEALRDDENFAYVAAWEYGQGQAPILHKEDLNFENVKPSTRSYK